MIKKIQNNSILVFAFFISLVQAGTDGTIRGQVTDIDKNSLPGAQVFITELSIGAVADVNGNYIILNVPVGTYDVAVMMMGYQKQNISGVEVIMDKTIWLNFSLPIEAFEGEEVDIIGNREM
ncbi:MAG: carboxypeptidase-like regulatory domain-containing protein, partial [Candidatus Marinimicrobia bacterium]|nr:carboxypeptidase-like regulatory domain-containing protein [Candidatus Neomarinimicrobiota bacterium]